MPHEHALSGGAVEGNQQLLLYSAASKHFEEVQLLLGFFTAFEELVVQEGSSTVWVPRNLKEEILSTQSPFMSRRAWSDRCLLKSDVR